MAQSEEAFHTGNGDRSCLRGSAALMLPSIVAASCQNLFQRAPPGCSSTSPESDTMAEPAIAASSLAARIDEAAQAIEAVSHADGRPAVRSPGALSPRAYRRRIDRSRHRRRTN